MSHEIFVEIDNLARALPLRAVPFAAALMGVDEGIKSPVVKSFILHTLAGRYSPDTPMRIEPVHESLATLHVLMGNESEAARDQLQSCYDNIQACHAATPAREASEYRDAVYATLRVGADQARRRPPPTAH